MSEANGGAIRARAGSGKLRVLLLAEMCNPNQPSVPLVAYSMARALGEHDDLDVTLVTQIRNKSTLDDDPIAQATRIQYIDTEWICQAMMRVGGWLGARGGLSWTTSTATGWPTYMVFEKMVHRRFGGEFRAHGFDLIHRVSPLTPTFGSPLARSADVPMLIGPLNGGLPWPKEFPGLRSREREWLVPLRGMYRRLPYYRSTYQHARGIIAGSRHTASEIPDWFRGRRYYLPENGFDPRRLTPAEDWTPPPAGRRFRFVTIGRLVPYKGFDLILDAMARSDDLRQKAELVIIGDGPVRADLEARAAEQGLSGNVTFAGWVPHTELHNRIRGAQAFVFPSLREFGGGVVVEAMACGLPPIVVDHGGPGEIATDECGFRLPMRPREELVPLLSDAMKALVDDPERCRAMAAEAIRIANEVYAWPRKAGQVVRIYRDLLDRPEPAEERESHPSEEEHQPTGVAG